MMFKGYPSNTEIEHGQTFWAVVQDYDFDTGEFEPTKMLLKYNEAIQSSYECAEGCDRQYFDKDEVIAWEYNIPPLGLPDFVQCEQRLQY